MHTYYMLPYLLISLLAYLLTYSGVARNWGQCHRSF